MYCRRCRGCGIKFPSGPEFINCPGCDEPTQHVVGSVDEDWEARLAVVSTPEVVVMDKVFDWRFEELKKAGYHIVEAMAIASDRRIDLHKAVSLRAKTDLAYQILI